MIHRRSVFGAIVAAIVCASAFGETATVEVVVKTANLNHAGTPNKVFFSLLHGGKGRNAKRPPATAELNHPKVKDFSAGKTSKFEVQLDCSVDHIRGFALSVGDHDDAWACAGIKFQIVQGGKRSQVYSMQLPKSQIWFSAAANDGGKKSPAKQYRYWNVAAPKMSRK